MKNILLSAVILMMSAFAWAHPTSNAQIRTAIAQIMDYAGKQDFLASNQTSSSENNADPDYDPTVTLTADGNNQFHVRAMVNGAVTDFLVDTGATLVFISREEARRVGIDLDRLNYNQQAQTADNVILFAEVTLDEISIGDIKARNVRAAISQSDHIGTNLLGMTFFSKIQSVQFAGNRMILKN